MTKLSVNLNKVALLRNQRDVPYPSLIETARVVLEAGAHGITVHPRPDQRHIRYSDVPELAAFLADWPDKSVEFNIEGYPDEAFLDLVTKNKCDQVTLVPDAPDQKTSDHGWDPVRQAALLKEVVPRLTKAGRRVSLFVDPVPVLIDQFIEFGCDRVELYTGPYAEGTTPLQNYVDTAKAAQKAGLGVNAGHDLTLYNLARFVAVIPFCTEVSIGHAITADALMMGWKGAVSAYLAAISYGQKTAKAA